MACLLLRDWSNIGKINLWPQLLSRLKTLTLFAIYEQAAYRCRLCMNDYNEMCPYFIETYTKCNIYPDEKPWNIYSCFILFFLFVNNDNGVFVVAVDYDDDKRLTWMIEGYKLSYKRRLDS